MITIDNIGDIIIVDGKSITINKDLLIPKDDDITIDMKLNITCNEYNDKVFIIPCLMGYDLFAEGMVFGYNVVDNKQYKPIIYNYSMDDIVIKKGTRFADLFIYETTKTPDTIYDYDGLNICYKEKGYKVEKVSVESYDNNKDIIINMIKR
jgi:hypothetical protein